MLVDTSVWIAHLRGGEDRLGTLLADGVVVTHPFVVGEMACGVSNSRGEVLSLLRRLDAAPVARHEEAMSVLERHRLAGRGLGWVDVHLLASALLAGVGLWTRDRALAMAAADLGVGASI